MSAPGTSTLGTRTVRVVLVTLELVALLIGVLATVAMGLVWLAPVAAVVAIAGLVAMNGRRRVGGRQGTGGGQEDQGEQAAGGERMGIHGGQGAGLGVQR